MDRGRLHLIMKYQPCGKRRQRRFLKRLIDRQRGQNRSRGLKPCRLRDDHDEQKNNPNILKAQFLPSTKHTVLVKAVSVTVHCDNPTIHVRVTHATQHPIHTLLCRLKHILPQHSNIFNDVFLLIILQRL
jgi:hypothetical protein